MLYQYYNLKTVWYNMSNLLANYLKTVIYKIQCKDETISDIYIGHTT